MGGQAIADCLLQFKQKDKWLLAGKAGIGLFSVCMVFNISGLIVVNLS